MNIYNNSEFKLGEAKKLGSLGETKILKKTHGFIDKTMDIKKLKNNNVNLKKEEDRIVFSGTFKRTDKVNIILYNNFELKYYDVRISKHPYTALCVDIFTEEENEKGISITKYINNVNLKGKYSVYVSVNDKIYNTNKYVEF